MPLLDSNDHDFIRHKIDQGVTTAACPPDRIEECIPEAEAWVASRADVDALDPDDAEDAALLMHAKRAACYYVASLLAPTVNVPTSDAAGGLGSYTRKVEEPAVKARRLLGMAQNELAFLTDTDEITDRPPSSGSAQNLPVW